MPAELKLAPKIFKREMSLMALGRTAKKPAQVLLQPVNQSRWAITDLLSALPGSLDTDGLSSVAGLPQHTLLRAAREGEVQSKVFSWDH